ncbi:Dyp-type peroxidase [Catenulispora yoronensis]|uniref:Dyp-type peroxidase n=1 Tax=Catenulispora yoronensis TaxID=450799 RepID=A0ABN2UNJ1_9ACTN
MNTPQPVTGELTTAAVFLTLTIDEGGEQKVRELLADLSGLARSVGFRVPGSDLMAVAGIGSAAWDRLFGGTGAPRPPHLHPFAALRGPRHHAPATPGDLLLHIRATDFGPCWELARLIMGRLDGAARVADEVHGFGYFDRRDLLGFVDGTENPSGAAASAAALDEDGGSYVIVQKYLHDLAAWNRLSTEQQERVVGRTKLDDVELSDAAQAPDSHVALNQVFDPDGTQRQIVRMNMPFGSLANGESGTYFIGYAADPAVTERMLRNMFLGAPAGNTDRILEFSTAVTGALFYVPPISFLDDADSFAADPDPGPATDPDGLAGPADSTAPAASTTRTAADGSLGIGSLKRSTA